MKHLLRLAVHVLAGFGFAMTVTRQICYQVLRKNWSLLALYLSIDKRTKPLI